MTPKTAVILLDLGGVLLELRDPHDVFELNLTNPEFHERWLLSRSVREHERGKLDIDAFSRSAVAEFGLPYDADEFRRRFEYWPDAIYEGVLPLLDSLSQTHRLALLSNTNPTHWNRKDIGDVLAPRLHELFLSYRTGHLKPDRDAFDDVLGHFECPAAQILFLDDNPLNIEAARRSGMRAMLTRDYEQLVENLAESGIG